jgi:hypothetical protein
MTTPNIKFDRGQAKMLGLMTEATIPDSESLKDMVVACALLEEDEYDEPILAWLVRSYVSVRNAELYDEDDEDGLDLISDGDPLRKGGSDYVCEKIWLKYAKQGFVSGFSGEEAKQMKKAEKESPGTLNEMVCCYHFLSDISWPPALLASIAYASGFRDYRRAVEMRKFYRAMREPKIVTVSGE